MAAGDLLNVHPRDLKLPFELRKQTSCSMQLTNKTDGYVAFKVKTTNPKKYCVRPNVAVIMPGETCTVTVTMQAPKEIPADMQSKDKFLIQSVPAPVGATVEDIKPDIFEKENGKVVEEFKLRVIYIPANPPSPVPEEAEEGDSPKASITESNMKSANLNDVVTNSFELSKEMSSQAWTRISLLTEEKASALQQNQRLYQEVNLLRSRTTQKKSSSLLFAAVFLLGIFIGYSMKKWSMES